MRWPPRSGHLAADKGDRDGTCALNHHRIGLKTADFTIFDTGFEGSGIAGLGLGYKFNNWLRFDVTSEYRDRSTFHGLDRYINSPVPPPGNTFGTDQYTATLKSWVSLANVYWDIGC